MLATPSIRAMQTYKRTTPLQKGFNIQWKNLHMKEKIITTKKGLPVLAIGILAIILPSPLRRMDDVTEVDCLKYFEEPFIRH